MTSALMPAYTDRVAYGSHSARYSHHPYHQERPPLLSTDVDAIVGTAHVQKAGAFVPRTAEDWNVHRDVISSLYEELPLREVQRIMETNYNFKATKRMYNTRLKRWDIWKNYRAEEKEELAGRIAQAHVENRPIDTINFRNKPVKVNRVLRHCRTTARKRRGSTTLEVSKVKKGKGSEASSEDSTDSNRGSTDRDEMVRVPRSLGVNMTRRTPRSGSSSSGFVLLTPESGDTSATILTPSASGLSDNEVVPYITGGQATQEDQVPSPDPPIFPAKGPINVELILNQTQTYYLAHLESIRSEATDIYNVTAASNLFWSNVKSAIYFLKMKTPTLAWPLFNEACGLVGDVLSNSPILFLNSVFAVLSPVNTRICPLARSTLLRHLSNMASIKLTPLHPLAILFREIAQEDEFGFTSETAMLVTLNLLRQHLGGDHTGTFTVQRSLISLLRRDQRLVEAKQQSEELVRTTEQALVSQVGLAIQAKKPTSISMTELCIAMTELVHVYIDMKEYAVAKDICDKVIQNYKMIQGPSFPDSRAAYAMEDMAQLSEQLGDNGGATYWLGQAMEASCLLRGESDAATQHVKNKMDELVKKMVVTCG
ncbi:hypothetical protein PV08_06758 [Exophiala spinifera]|uniref:Clr5 domain-containing protein n=1 Tax=Exophiala spinifera TaxID=91928 RepID=A0A0D1ZMF4_9EURO|nr:uncharacterized protein PV08_06758 [Exophiala spinifera]KIW13977.1 hypothetical protein PV08_06758 [Exophiala spinifera]